MDSPFECVCDLGAQLGEGPIWEPERQTLRFTDIVGQRIHRFDPASRDLETMDLGEELGCFASMADEAIVAAMRSGVYRIDEKGTRTLLAANPETYGSRFNDGTIDPRGRLLVGTIDTGQKGRACLYRYDGRGLKRLVKGLNTSNGLAFSPDGRTLYHSDTPRFVIFSYAYDSERGEITDRRIFVQWQPTGTDRGRPDGAAVDAEGCYWSALFQGARVNRYAPTGELLASYPIPAHSPTMPCFGGADMQTLFVTSAREGGTAAQLELFPQSGGLFAMRVETPGLKKPFFDPEI